MQTSVNSNFASAKANIQTQGITIFKQSPEHHQPVSRQPTCSRKQRYDEQDHSFASVSLSCEHNPDADRADKKMSANDMVKIEDHQDI